MKKQTISEFYTIGFAVGKVFLFSIVNLILTCFVDGQPDISKLSFWALAWFYCTSIPIGVYICLRACYLYVYDEAYEDIEDVE